MVPADPKASPGATAFLLFDTLSDRIEELHQLRQIIEGKMVDLKKSYNKSVPKTRLRLRPWASRKGLPPYALYWIFINKKKLEIDPKTLKVVVSKKPRRFKRLKIRSKAALDGAIFRGGLTGCREIVHDFHRQALALNEAHRIVARGLDSLRKQLVLRTSDYDFRFEVPTLPRYAWSGFLPGTIEHLIGMAWMLEHLVRHHIDRMKELARRQRADRPKWLRFVLLFKQDRSHPYGRLCWIDDRTGIRYWKLDDRTKRRLRLCSDVSKAITPFERERRRVVRDLHAKTKLIRRIKLKSRRAIERAREIFMESFGVDVTVGLILFRTHADQRRCV